MWVLYVIISMLLGLYGLFISVILASVIGLSDFLYNLKVRNEFDSWG